MDDLKSRFDAAMEGVTSPPEDLPGVMKQGLRKRARRTLAAVGAMCLVVAAGLIGAVTLLSGDNTKEIGGRIPAAPIEPSETSGSSVDSPTAFYPTAGQRGDRMVMDVAFPDGLVFELVYEPGLELQRESVDVDANFNVGAIDFAYKGENGAASLSYDETVSTGILNSSGTWTRWEVRAVDQAPGFRRFGPWLVHLETREGPLAQADDNALTRSITAFTNGSGFPVVYGTGPLEMWPQVKGAPVTQLHFGEEFSLLSRCVPLEGQARSVEGITLYVQQNGESVQWCDASGSITFQTTGIGRAERIAGETTVEKVGQYDPDGAANS